MQGVNAKAALWKQCRFFFALVCAALVVRPLQRALSYALLLHACLRYLRRRQPRSLARSDISARRDEYRV